jgi:predicted nicotinamide N-methyase
VLPTPPPGGSKPPAESDEAHQGGSKLNPQPLQWALHDSAGEFDSPATRLVRPVASRSTLASTLDPSNPLVIGGYPTRLLQVELEAIRVQLLVVDRLEDFVDTAALLRDADAPEPPYWAHLWPGSRALARLVATQHNWGGRRVMEIGCGLGLPGIVAARRGAAVTMIDTSHDALRFVRANAELNGCALTPIQTDLRVAAVRGRFDYCLAADVAYDPALQAAVGEFLAQHLTPGGRAWCAESVRTLDRGLRDACAARGLRVSEHDVREPDPDHDVLVRVTEISRPVDPP